MVKKTGENEYDFSI